MSDGHGKTGGRTRGRLILVGLALIVGGGLLGWGMARWLAPGVPQHADVEGHAKATHEDATGKRDTLWTCSMHPQIRLPQPGQCPICFMDLIPLKEGDSEAPARSLREIRLSERARKLAQVRTSPVIRKSPGVETRLTGQVAYDETRLGTITARVGGRIDRLYVDYTGAFVKKGQPMAEIYSPELYAAQSELIQAVKSLPDVSEKRLKLIRESAGRTMQAAREKLRLLGLTEAQMDAVANRGVPSEHVTLHATLTGVVIRREVTEGVYVSTGSPIYTIADLSRVWVVLEAYESDLPWVRRGAQVAFRTDAFPGRSFSGKVVFIDPFLNEKTRTVRVRLEAENPDRLLRPGMYVRAVQRTGLVKSTGSDAQEPLLIPASAPLITGKRAVVYVAVPGDEGAYEGREVVLGPRAGDWYVVREGLEEGDRVVTRGAFKLDSALQIQAKPSMMDPEPGAAPAAGHDHAMETDAEKEALKKGAWTLSRSGHREIETLAAEVNALGDVLAAGDLDAARASFKNIYERTAAMAEEPPEGEAGLFWRELIMLIQNDTLLGSDAVDVGEARFLYGELSRHVERSRGMFRPATVEASPALSDVPHAFRRGLGEVVSAYVPICEALAADDGEDAKKGLHDLSLALANLDRKSLPVKAQAAWKEAGRQMREGIHAMGAVSDISDLRAAFEPLSNGLIEAVLQLGIEMDQPVFEVFCPMAFENRGAYWVQLDDRVRNPYFGAAMLACGEVRRQLAKP
jgi:membrane fusion protein, copper/silver efflux system